MTSVADLELPEIDLFDPELRGERFHTTMRDLAEQSWIVQTPLGFIVLDREAGSFFLRTKQASFPGLKIAELFGIDDGPLHEEIVRNILHVAPDNHRRLRAYGSETGWLLAVLLGIHLVFLVMGMTPAREARES